MRKLTFKAGETILTEGEQGHTAYLLSRGRVEVVVGTGASSKRVAILGTGEVFGEMSLLEPGPRSASVVALADVECTETTYDEFIASIQEHPEQVVVFMQTLVRRLRQSNEMLSKLDPRKRGLRGMLADLQQQMSLDTMDFRDETAIHPYFSW